jgi:hypothetical protein
VKLEYFDDAYEGQDVLLFHSGTATEVKNLCQTVRKLFVQGTSLALHSLDFIEAVDTCKVTASSVATGEGVSSLAGLRTFAWSLSPSEWKRVESLLEPFCKPLPPGSGARFQFLHERGGTEVIYSTAREW